SASRSLRERRSSMPPRDSASAIEVESSGGEPCDSQAVIPKLSGSSPEGEMITGHGDSNVAASDNTHTAARAFHQSLFSYDPVRLAQVVAAPTRRYATLDGRVGRVATSPKSIFFSEARQ